MSTTCQICGSTSTTPVIAQDDVAVVTCTECNFVFMETMPSEEVQAAIYDDAYDGASAGYFAKVDSKMRRSRRRARAILRMTANKSDTRPRFLDVGANGGFMTEAAREQGFDCVGVEIDQASVAYAREHYSANEFFLGSIEAYQEAANGATFDAVYCSEVIEHVPDLNPFVEAIAKLMTPDALLYLTTPDYGHWRRPKNLPEWDAFCLPSHCVYFDRQTLSRLLEKHGLKIFRYRFSLKPGLKVLARKF